MYIYYSILNIRAIYEESLLRGALGLPDIGQLFPDNDPRWRGANSEQFFDEAVRLMKLRGKR